MKSNSFWNILTLFIILPALILAKPGQNETIKRQRIDLPNGTKLMPYLSHYDANTLFPLLREAYDVNIGHNFVEYAANFEDDPNLKKVIFFESFRPNPKFPKSKMILFRWEASRVKPSTYDEFSVVYTFDDDLVDGVKFFKYYYPSLLPMLPLLPAFKEKKLCTMVASHWTDARIKIVEFFETKPFGDFEFYGHFRYGRTKAEKLGTSKMYQGPIPGCFTSSSKLAVLSKYRFCICFENHQNVKGYITEKIFHCFAAGCVPIYWGPENVADYIPKTCFIDYRDFQSDEELYQFIKKMPKKTYEQYIDNIREFLQSPQAHLFSPEYFDQILLEAASR